MRKMYLFLCGVACALFLEGCASTYTPSVVDVPVEVQCKPPVVPVPDFPLKTIPVSAPVDTKVKAALLELYLRRIYEDQLVASIKVCGG